jgi:zinc protease
LVQSTRSAVDLLALNLKEITLQVLRRIRHIGRRLRIVKATARAAALLLAAVAVGATTVAAAAEPSTVTRSTLENGLRVVIVRDPLAPVVATSINYLVGADETPPGFPGTAHAQEHMMFRGSPGLSADQLANIGSVMGGSFNADTRQTVTQYYYTVPADDVDVALHIEAIRMAGVLDSEKDWQQERGAIEQEVAADLSSPQYVLFTKLRGALFEGTTYAHDGLGTRPSFDHTTAAMLKAFHDKWYAPNNAILFVVGDLDPDATLAKVRELFGPIHRHPLPPRPALTLGPVTPRHVDLATDLPYALRVLAMRMPGLESPDFAAIEILGDVLNSQRGALYDLVPQGKALSASFSFDPLPKSGMGLAVVAFPPNGDGASLERDLRAVLAKIAQEGVPPELVEAAKVQERRSAEFEKNSIDGLATSWSEAVAVYGLDSPDQELERLEKVSVDDVNRVARTYLDLDHAISATLTPEGSGRPRAGSGFGGQESIALGEAKPTPLPAWANSALGRLAVPPSMVHPTVSRLENGLTLIVQPENVSHTVSVFGHIRNQPQVQVPPGREGMTQILEQLLSYGSERLDRLAYQGALDAIGADENAGTDFSISVLEENFDRAVELMADNELHPALPQAGFDVVRQQTRDAVAGRLGSPGYLAGRALRTAIFPAGDPALREALPQTVATVTLDDVREYHHAAFRPDLTAIVVIGDVTPEAARATIEKYFGAWTAQGEPPVTTLPPVPPSKSKATAVPDASRVQDDVTLAETIAATRESPDNYPLKLGNTVLGGGFYSTRLTRDLRKNAGLVYSIDSRFELGKTRGIYAVHYACDPGNVTKVQASVARELVTMQKTRVSDDELARAKAMLLRQLPLAEASTSAIAQGLLGRWDLGLPLDEPTIAAQRYIELTAEDVRAAFASQVRAGDLARVSRGPAPR